MWTVWNYIYAALLVGLFGFLTGFGQAFGDWFFKNRKQ